MVVAICVRVMDRSENTGAALDAARLAITQDGLNSLSQGICITDADFVLVFANRAFFEILDMPLAFNKPGVTTAADVYRYNAQRGEYGPGDVEEQVDERMRLARLNLPHRFERVRPDGSVIEVAGSPLPDGGFISTFTDVTERYNAQRERAASEANLAEAQAIAKIGSWGHDFGEVWYHWSDEASRIMGYAPGAVEPNYESYFQRIHRDDRSAMTSAFAAARKAKRDYSIDYRILWPTGETRSVRERGRFNLGDDGEIVSVTGTLQDVTERKRAEAELLEAKEKAENADRAKLEFLANMSHDLRTPLNAILGFSDILIRQYFGPLGGAKYLEYANDIHASAGDLLELVNDLLDISAIEAGKTPMNRQMLSIRDIAAECVRTVREKAYSKGIELVMNVPEGLPPLYADQRALKQILHNLLSNAVKFTPVDGRVTVLANVSERMAEIVVADTGPGIPAESLAKITNPYAKGEHDPHKTDKGWGLGLAIAESLVALHDGKMDIESQLGAGTRITISLPLSVARPDAVGS